MISRHGCLTTKSHPYHRQLKLSHNDLVIIPGPQYYPAHTIHSDRSRKRRYHIIHTAQTRARSPLIHRYPNRTPPHPTRLLSYPMTMTSVKGLPLTPTFWLPSQNLPVKHDHLNRPLNGNQECPHTITLMSTLDTTTYPELPISVIPYHHLYPARRLRLDRYQRHPGAQTTMRSP